MRIFRALRAAMAALRKFVLKTVEVGGRLVSMLVPSEPVPEPAPSVDELVEVDHQVDETMDRFDAIKRLAADIRNADRDLIRAAGGPLIMDWLTAMTPIMRAKILMSTPDVISRHLRGSAAIRGVLACDKQAIAEFVRARKQKLEPPADQPDTDAELAWAMSM